MHAGTHAATVPPDFCQELDEAAAAGWHGRVALLGHECQGAPWELEGLRLVGRRQFAARALEGAAVTYESLRVRLPQDREANLLLATIWQQLGDIRRSDEARTRLREAPSNELSREGLETSVAGVLAAWPPAPSAAAARATQTLLFTGHRVDAPGRTTPRFPADKERAARAAIKAVVADEATVHGGAAGIAGAASGGDILFHEVCEEVGVPTRLFLALPPEGYIARSVADAGGDWIRRFWTIYQRHPPAPLLARSEELPTWLQHREPYSIWQRNNLWMLNEALTAGASAVTVVTLWNGEAGDGPGGTADMIAIARARGAEVRIIDTAAL